jgi:hypothetical protein
MLSALIRSTLRDAQPEISGQLVRRSRRVIRESPSYSYQGLARDFVANL